MIIIVLAFIFIVAIFFIAFFAGKSHTYKRFPKFVKEYTDKNKVIDFDALEFCTEAETSGISTGIFMLIYIAIFTLTFFISAFGNWRNNLLKEFEDDQYVKVVSVTRYTPTDSTRYENTYNVRYIKKDKFEKKIKSYEIEEIK